MTRETPSRAVVRFPSRLAISDAEVDHGRLGPAMQALLPRQRKFVVAMLDGGGTKYSRYAQIAGYSGDAEALASTGHRLAHDTKILAAIQEEGIRRVRASVGMATSQLVTLAETAPLHKDRLKAIEMILNRSGLHALTEHKVTVEHPTDPLSIVERIATLANKLGIDPKKLLGNNAQTESAPVVDAEFTEVEAGTEGLEDLL